jgi:hypothetical protein
MCIGKTEHDGYKILHWYTTGSNNIYNSLLSRIENRFDVENTAMLLLLKCDFLWNMQNLCSLKQQQEPAANTFSKNYVVRSIHFVKYQYASEAQPLTISKAAEVKVQCWECPGNQTMFASFFAPPPTPPHKKLAIFTNGLLYCHNQHQWPWVPVSKCNKQLLVPVGLSSGHLCAPGRLGLSTNCKCCILPVYAPLGGSTSYVLQSRAHQGL